ncbi:alpha-N-acetylglucosaminidase [Dyella psychrodurans]|uniref:Alpha-N-acetylglucosaminidase n=1 Tax=Dyella psychrodurans TaxID=1927960 RepID=A0A370X2P8_9GAMM|nr:alpha-N-acetylglucosaminidase [Dyella psychrodurans]RDS82694.1 alpha-N-acetylglucosaminidase [Dyella psychrodurans]
MRKHLIGLCLASLAAWLPVAGAHGADTPTFDIRPEQGVLERLMPHQAAQFELVSITAKDGHERFRISSEHGRIKIEGSTPSALLFGVDWYLKYVAHVQISPNGDRIGSAPFPLPTTAIEKETPYAYRYALNENVDGYTAPYWDWPRWQREIDVLALSGINAVLVERGMDTVLYQTFRDVGYSDGEIRHWITQPAHQNWQLMGNLCCFNGPISTTLMQKRAASAQKIIARLRELGITPVLPGFYGIVPADFQKKFPKARVVPQGEWAGFTRPGWLDPRDPMFAKLAASFYRHQRELFGDSSIYDMEVFQEGGDSGDVPVPEAARDVQNALLAAHPDARWMMLAWQGNPRQDLLAGVDRQHLLIIDIDHDRVPRDDRQKDFQGAPFLFGGIWEFGGRTTLGANVDNITDRLQRLGHINHNMIGTAVFTEGMDTNPFAFDLFTEMAWRDQPVDTQAWTDDYVLRRYGAADPHALAAWKILLNTAYNIRIDQVAFHSERDAAQESLFDAQPGLTVNRASNWSPEAMRYSAEAFMQTLPEMLQVAPVLRDSETYQYDLVDIARQTLANESRALLPQIKTAYDNKNRSRFEALTQHWLHLMDLQDQLLATNRFFLVGTWLAHVRPWASTPEERMRLDYDARSLLTTWGDRKASDGASLHDYGNKDWAGLTRDYYRLRWQTYFHALDDALRTGKPPASIDWFAMGDAWNHGTQHYADQPVGDAYTAASRVAQALQGTAQPSH